MREGVLHIRDVEGPKKTGSMEARLEAMEQQVFKCQGMVERGLNANHMMITEFTNKHKIDANDIGKHLSRLYDRIDHLQAQIYDLQNQNSSRNRIRDCAFAVLGGGGAGAGAPLGRIQTVDGLRRQRFGELGEHTGMAFAVSDELLGTFVPIAVYWLYSGLYIVLDRMEIDDYRLHPKGEEAVKNVVSKWTVVKGVLVQQGFQIAVSLLLFTIIGDDNGTVRKQPPALVIALQFIIAMFVMDTWQYFMHRYMHINKFLYKHIHSKHHTLVVPYAFGALYNHPLEGLILDTIGGALSFLVAGMTPRTAIFFFSFATIKTVDDHCGLWLPGNILHMLFSNNSAYHDIHHQLYGNKYNFSQPFFVMWDKILGTYMPYTLEERKGGGLEARPVNLGLAAQSKSD
ncbi:putative hydroxylase [Hordeum vulgare]|nr:putative hydroxylase [Hordeum vulgare]